MDKYAVDLDQVLNDFEYSELTDQYSNASRSASTTTSSLAQNSVTKHSINNVFHSLNEYLNTNISVNNVSQIDNNILENKENYVCDANAFNISHNKLKDEEKSIKDSNSKTDTLLFDFNGKTDEDKNVGESEVRNTEEKKENDILDVKDNKEICIERVIEENSSNTSAKVAEVKEEKEKIDVYINGNCDNVSKEIKETPVEEGILRKDTIRNMQESKDEVESVADENPIEKTEKVEHVEKIGFDNDLELDESEAMKLLDELENEELEPKEETKSDTVTYLLENAHCLDAAETGLLQKEDKEPESNYFLYCMIMYRVLF